MKVNISARTGRTLILAAGLLAALFVGGCSGNRRVSVGGSVHMGSGGSWGHSLSVGIHSHRGRR